VLHHGRVHERRHAQHRRQRREASELDIGIGLPDLVPLRETSVLVAGDLLDQIHVQAAILADDREPGPDEVRSMSVFATASASIPRPLPPRAW
jgi:hypothetical protein